MSGTFLLKTDIYGVFWTLKTENDFTDGVIPVGVVLSILCISKNK